MIMEYLQFLGSLLLAIILGSIVGLEREANNHPAGLRTHALVCIGSTLITIVSWKTFTTFSYSGDPTRIAAQIVSGIGFLGAGTILREGVNIKGLTTAASLWNIAGVGLAIGFGHYYIAIVATLLTIVVLHLFNKWEKKIVFTKQNLSIKIIVIDKPGMLGIIGTVLGKLNVDIKNIILEPYDSKMQIILQVKLPLKLKEQQVIEELIKIEGVINIEYED